MYIKPDVHTLDFTVTSQPDRRRLTRDHILPQSAVTHNSLMFPIFPDEFSKLEDHFVYLFPA